MFINEFPQHCGYIPGWGIVVLHGLFHRSSLEAAENVLGIDGPRNRMRVTSAAPIDWWPAMKPSCTSTAGDMLQRTAIHKRSHCLKNVPHLQTGR